ncbi:acetyltransferase [Erythrobacter aureus]|uniref:Acetyltransferase n=1 Tax=Erythrobacter aureus TaxID=2182384 RepID=A0A345YFY6_9SPHN|nr:acetyltransferase [Erythrobacter aureus]AXK42838.1 acetyltransferase [Erythrobacter aureus]
MTLYGVYGASGFGREVMPLLYAQVGDNPDAHCVFVDDSAAQETINGHKCVTFEQFVNYPSTDRAITLAIADGNIRRKLATKCKAAGLRFLSVKARNCMVLDQSPVSEGMILCGFATITSNVTIGHHFHGNIYSYVAHDSVIGDFVTFAPGVMCNGNVHIEDHAYIGAGAVLRQGKPGKPLIIGAGAIVGMGAVVTRDVPPGTTVIGNPAKPLVKD